MLRMRSTGGAPIRIHASAIYVQSEGEILCELFPPLYIRSKCYFSMPLHTDQSAPENGRTNAVRSNLMPRSRRQQDT
jgi:hypothetical protein